MITRLLRQNIIKPTAIYDFFRTDIVFTISFVLALASCAAAQPQAGYIDFRVLVCLFNLMIVIKAFEELRLLEKLSVGILNRCRDSRGLSFVLIGLSFFASMIFTNDVALMTLVPLALIIGRKSGLDMTLTVVFQTLAANIGSSLTPMGNPQNLYIYSFYNLQAGQFFSAVGIFVFLGLIWLAAINRFGRNESLEVSLEKVELGDKRTCIAWTIVFIIIVLSVFRLIDYRAAFAVTMAAVLMMNRKLLLKADYRLLMTFFCFFIFIGNVSNFPAVGNLLKNLLKSGTSAYFGSVLLSQVISNVPCAILLSGFTSNWKELLLGVNTGGMGTIIASLASVISYKLYIGEKPENAGRYMLKFSIWNTAGLILFTGINYLLVTFVLL